MRSDLSGAPKGSAEKSVKTADGVVHLPPYRIVYLPPFLFAVTNHLHWRYVAIPGAEILSCCDDDITERFVRWAILNQLLQDAVVPGDLQAGSAVPTALILLNEKALPREIVPLAQEKRRQMGEELAKFGTPMVDNSRVIAQINLQDADSDGGDIAWGAYIHGFEFDPQHLFFELAGRKPPPPLWFVEGILNFRYPSPAGNFQIKAFQSQDDGQNEDYDGAVVNVLSADWISHEVTEFLRGINFNDADNDREQNRLHQLLVQRMLPLRKTLTKPPLPAGDESPESVLERKMLPVRKLFAGPPPPDGSPNDKNSELSRGGVDAGKMAAVLGETLPAIEREQVEFLLNRGGEEKSPWRFDLWTTQPPLFERMVFDGMPIRRVLTETPPSPASDDEKKSWFERTGLGIDPDNSPDEAMLRHRAQLVLRDGADQGSPWQLEIWKAQAALFIRWAFDDSTHSRREALWKLARYAATAPVTEEIFKSLFGLTFEQMDAQLYDYLPVAMNQPFVLFPSGSFRIPAVDKNALSRVFDFGDKANGLELRDPTASEKSRILGDWERKEIDFVRDTLPAYTDLYIGQAKRTLMIAYNDGARDPALLAALGLFECTVHNDATAQGFLEAAVNGRVVRPRAYVELARIRLAAALADPGAAGGRLDAWQSTPVLNLLQAARAQPPPQLAAYLLLTEVLEHASATPAPADFAMLNEGLYFFPLNTELNAAATRLRDRFNTQRR